jgi:F-box/leucine-rich repeat protein 7
MYWLVRGAVAVTSRDGESTYAELKPGSFFGEIGVLMSIPRTATIVARTKCLLVVLKKEDLAKELPKFPDVESAIREEAQERLAILESKKKAKEDQGPSHQGRREKRALEEEDVAPDTLDTYKRRKSPSPGIVEAAASSALGSGAVHIRSLLRELPLFSGLPSHILHFIGSNAQQRTFPPFTDIIKQNSQGREVYFIVRGEVEVIDEGAKNTKGGDAETNAAGRTIKTGQQVKARLRQGSYFGEVASLSLAPRRTATVRTVGSVECLLITGEVLAAFWSKCPQDIRQQVEKTAKQRLHSTSENDVVMADVAADNAPSMDGLAIADEIKARRRSVPTVKVGFGRSESPPNLQSQQEPVDPDPYLNTDLDNVRARSRRSSLAPVSPESSPEAPDRNSLSPSKSKIKHATPSPAPTPTPKRPKTLFQSVNSFSKGPLPDNILVNIFSHLELHQLVKIRRVSMHWSKILKETPNLFRHLDRDS